MLVRWQPRAVIDRWQSQVFATAQNSTMLVTRRSHEGISRLWPPCDQHFSYSDNSVIWLNWVMFVSKIMIYVKSESSKCAKFWGATFPPWFARLLPKNGPWFLILPWKARRNVPAFQPVGGMIKNPVVKFQFYVGTGGLWSKNTPPHENLGAPPLKLKNYVPKWGQKRPFSWVYWLGHCRY